MRRDPAGLATPEDGPWRRADDVRLIWVTGEVGAIAETAAQQKAEILRGLGLPLRDLRIVPRSGGDWSTLLPRRGRSGFDCLVIDDAVDLDGLSGLEMRGVAGTDPMIAFSLPAFEAAMPQARAGAMARRRGFFPPVTYAALPDRRCLYLVGAVWAEFGPDPGAAEPDWDDAALALNRFGFRVVQANHAIAFGRSAEAEDTDAAMARRAARLEPAHPGARRAVGHALSGAGRQAARLFEALRPDPDGKRSIAFDLAHLSPRHSGTSELARALMAGASRDWPDCALHAVATPAVYDFHVKALPHPPARLDPEDPRPVAALIRIGQPFSWKDIDRAMGRAPVLIVFMLDAIGLDCQLLAPDDLDAVFRFTLHEADGLLFNSAFTARQLARRFGRSPNVPRVISLHSLATDEYRDGTAARASSPSKSLFDKSYLKTSGFQRAAGPLGPARFAGQADRQGGALSEPHSPQKADGLLNLSQTGARTRGNVLIMGNELPHKRVEATARLLAEAEQGLNIVALGPASGAIPGVVTWPSGGLDATALARLFEAADLIVYPSLYEGFGFPVLQALAWRKPVALRRLSPFEEIAAGLPEANNLHFFDSDADLLRITADPPLWNETLSAVTARNWEDCAGDLRRLLDQALEAAHFERVLRRIEFMRGRMAWSRARQFQPQDGIGGAQADVSEDLDRIAGFAGRLTQNCVYWLGRGRLGRALLKLRRRRRC